MSDTIFLRQGDKLVSLVRTEFGCEADIQALLADYPEVIAGSQINPEDPRRWLLVAREMSVPDAAGESDEFRIDHLFIDQDAVPTLVEVKGSWSTELRREVVGQMLDYASRAAAFWTADRLADRFGARCAHDGLDAVTVLRQHLQVPDDPRSPADDFWRRAESNLRAGNIRLLFVADRVPESLKRVVEFLNSQMRMTEVLALELPQFVGSGVQTLVPRLFGMTAETRTRRRASSGSDGSASADAWTEADFINHMRAKHGEQAEAITNALLEAARASGAKIATTVTALIPTWPRVARPDWQTDLDWVFPFHIKDYGSIVTYFTSLRNRPPFDRDSVRLELLEKLNAIPGVSISRDSVNGKPGFPLAALGPPTSLAAFVAVMDWVREQVQRAAGIELRPRDHD